MNKRCDLGSWRSETPRLIDNNARSRSLHTANDGSSIQRTNCSHIQYFTRNPLFFKFDADLEVDTVGGLLALELGRVPLPGAEVVSHGLRLLAEGGPDQRGRMRIGTVLLSPAEPDDPEDG